LNDIIDQPAGVGAQRTPKSAHHTSRDCVLKPVRIADCNCHLANPKSLRVSERCGNESGSVVAGQTDADHGEIGRGIVADDLSWEALPIWQGDVDARGAMDDMAVRQRQAVGSEHKS
jgi:hypothetical protein